MLSSLFKKIPASVKFLNRSFAFGILIFFVFRLLFFLIYKSSNDANFLDVLKSFFFGLRFDNALICYSFFLPILFLFINDFSNYKLKILKRVSVYIVTSIFLIYQFICAANIPYYKQFGNHLNKSALLWKNNTSFVLGFIFENFSYWGFLFVFILTATVTVYFFNKLSRKLDKESLLQTNPKKPLLLAWFTCYVGLLIIGARGTFSQKTTLHEGFSIISSNPFINNICLNPNYSFFKSIVLSQNKLAYSVPENINESFVFTRNYLKISSSFEKNIDRIDSVIELKNKPNVVLVIMESMSIAKMGYYKWPNLTPNLNKLNKESVFFNRFFSSGIHTFNGLFSTTTGFPSLYSEHSLEQYTKTNFNGIGTLLKNEGYSTYFGSTHDSQFDNMEGFFRLNNFDNIINQSSMPTNKVISTLGVPDHILFNEFVSTINKRTEKTPFLGVLMTSTDHGPWIIPTDIPFKPSSTDEMNRCAQYADWAIGQFILSVKKQSWYKNTVFLFVADHGCWNGPYEMTMTFNHVPLIIHQPSVFKADTISSPCYQPDIVSTIMAITGTTFKNNTFGVNILKQKHPFVVFSADDKIGIVDSSGFFYYKTLSDNQRFLRKYINSDEANYLQSYPQKADSMDKNMKHIFDATQYLIREKYYLE